jgi:anhydro-N-acetylmuramic acid kinase
MKALEQLFCKKKKLVIGLMSGTSADGIDAVVVELFGSGTATRIRQHAFQTYPYPRGLKEFLFKNSHPKTATLNNIARLNILVGELFADAARKIARKAGKKLSEIDLIGSHGQTILHLPDVTNMFGKNIRATLQVGHPSLIAKRTGVVTVGDFRIGDVAVGGTGAPLVPYVEYVLFRSQKINRGLLNIGGIANITVLPRNCLPKDIFAFDTGPGNMVIDGLMQRLFHQHYDNHGIFASQGKIISSLLDWMNQHPYLRQLPPKSTGRETFGESFIAQILRRAKGERRLNVITTVTEFTALAVYQNYLQFIKPTCTLDELLVSGGGIHNKYLFSALKRHFEGVNVVPLEEFGFSSDAKEAICFAVLANETISGNPANVGKVTGAARETILGVIALP